MLKQRKSRFLCCAWCLVEVEPQGQVALGARILGKHGLCCGLIVTDVVVPSRSGASRTSGIGSAHSWKAQVMLPVDS